MPGSDGPENLKISKKSQLGVDFGPCRQTVGLSAIEADSWSWGTTMMVRSWGTTMMVRSWGSDHEVEKLRLDHEMCRTLGGGEVSIVWYERPLRIVSLSPRLEEMKSEINNCVRTWTTELPVYLFSPVYESSPIVCLYLTVFVYEYVYHIYPTPPLG